VAVEKLAHSEFPKIGSRQEALQTIFLSLLDIFYRPIFNFFQEKRLFQQPPLLSTSISKDQRDSYHSKGEKLIGLCLTSFTLDKTVSLVSS
jgi:hypothetical protein